MILSVHLADVGFRRSVSALRRPPDREFVDGLRWSKAAALLAIGHVPPRPLPGHIGLIAAWDDDAALDSFLETHRWGGLLRAGYHARFTVLMSQGSWSALPQLESATDPGLLDEPVGVLTLGRLIARRAPSFFRATARAERTLLSSPGLLATVGLIRPPFLSTFSLWESSATMQAYARGVGHTSASREHHQRPFHRESIFVRLRPYSSTGTWAGTNPFAGLLPAGNDR